MDFDRIKSEYIAGGTSYKKLSEKYGVSVSAVKRAAVREGWVALRDKARAKADSKLANIIGSQKANTGKKINDVADKLLDKMSNILDRYETLDSQTIKHFTSALKDIKDIKGIKSAADVREQKARIKKLERDCESEAIGTVKVVFEDDNGEDYSK